MAEPRKTLEGNGGLLLFFSVRLSPFVEFFTTLWKYYCSSAWVCFVVELAADDGIYIDDFYSKYYHGLCSKSTVKIGNEVLIGLKLHKNIAKLCDLSASR